MANFYFYNVVTDIKALTLEDCMNSKEDLNSLVKINLFFFFPFHVYPRPFTHLFFFTVLADTYETSYFVVLNASPS